MGRILDISEALLLLGLTEPTEVERAVVQQCLGMAEGAIRRHLRYDPVQSTRTEFYPTQDLSAQARGSTWEVSDTVAYTRQLAGASTDELQLSGIPVRSITSLYVDHDGRAGSRSGSFAAETLLTQGEDYFPSWDKYDSSGNPVSSDGIIRSQGRWPLVAGAIKVVYVAGFTAAEFGGSDTVLDASPIRECVIDETTRRVQKHMSRAKKALAGWTGGPLTSESLGKYSYSVDGATLAKLVGGSNDLLGETVARLEEYVNWGWMLTG
jgi:hypothetical protein